MPDLEHDCPRLAEFARCEGRWPVEKPCRKCGKKWRWEPSEGEWQEMQ